MIDRTAGSMLADRMLNFQAKKGEPYLFGLQENNPEQLILGKGFSKVKNATAENIKNMYFKKNSRGKKIHPFWGIIHATV